MVQRLRELRLKVGYAAAALLLTGIAGYAWRAEDAKKAAEAQTQAAVADKAAAESQLAQFKALAEQYDEDKKALARTYRNAESAIGELDGPSKSRADQGVRQALVAIAAQAASGAQQAAAEPLPRVYIHIAEAGQRKGAEEFGQALAARKLGATRIIFAGVQLVEKQSSTGVLRCFRADECREGAAQLLALANELLQNPVLQLQDLSSQYQNNTVLRPLHFEVWFGHAEVRLK